MKYVVLSLLLMAGTIPLAAQRPVIVISDPLKLSGEELIEIPWRELRKQYPDLDPANFRVIDPVSKKSHPYQLESQGNKEIQNLLVLVQLQPGKEVQLQLVKGRPDPVVSRTFARYVPERKDDFAWENDRIAHRVYGKALEKFPNEMAYGIDVWVKRTKDLIIDTRYKKNDYHKDHGDGLDYYHVGRTLGAGAIAVYLNDSIWYPGTYDAWKILDNGPLRSGFRLSYTDWDLNGRKMQMEKTVIIDAGSQLSKTMVRIISGKTESLPMVTGIIKRKEAGEMLLSETDGLLAYWEPVHGDDGTTGVACIFTTPVTKMKVDSVHLLAETLSATDGTITYYHGAAWDKAGIIRTGSEWFEYLRRFKKRVDNPLKIQIK